MYDNTHQRYPPTPAGNATKLVVLYLHRTVTWHHIDSSETATTTENTCDTTRVSDCEKKREMLRTRPVLTAVSNSTVSNRKHVQSHLLYKSNQSQVMKSWQSRKKRKLERSSTRRKRHAHHASQHASGRKDGDRGMYARINAYHKCSRPSRVKSSRKKKLVTALVCLTAAFLVGLPDKVWSDGGDHERQPRVQRSSAVKRIGYSEIHLRQLANRKIEEGHQVDCAGQRIVSRRHGHSRRTNSHSNQTPQQHDNASGNGEFGNVTNVGGGHEKCALGKLVLRYSTGDDGPQACKSQVAIPENGAHFVAGLLLEEVTSGGRTHQTSEKQELASLEGETKVERSEDTESDKEAELSLGEPWNRCCVGSTERRLNEHKHDEHIPSHEGLEHHAHFSDGRVVPAQDEGGSTHEEADESESHFQKAANEEEKHWGIVGITTGDSDGWVGLGEANGTFIDHEQTPEHEQRTGFHEGKRLLVEDLFVALTGLHIVLLLLFGDVHCRGLCNVVY